MRSVVNSLSFSDGSTSTSSHPPLSQIDLQNLQNQLIYKDNRICELSNVINDKEREILDLQELCYEKDRMASAKNEAMRLLQHKIMMLEKREVREVGTETDSALMLSSDTARNKSGGAVKIPGHLVVRGYSPPPLDPSEYDDHNTTASSPNHVQLHQQIGGDFEDTYHSSSRKQKKRVTFNLTPKNGEQMNSISSCCNELEHEEYERELEQLKIEKESMQLNFQTTIALLQKEKAELLTSVTEKETSLRDAKHAALKHRALSQSKIRELEDNIADLKSTSSKRVDSLQFEIDSLRGSRDWEIRHNGVLKEEICEIRSKILQLTNELDESETKNRDLHKELKTGNELNDALMVELLEAESLVVMMEEQKNDILNDVDRLKGAVSSKSFRSRFVDTRYIINSDALQAQDSLIDLLEADVVIYEEHIGILRESLGASKIDHRSIIRSRAFEAKLKALELEKEQFCRRSHEDKIKSNSLKIRIEELEDENEKLVGKLCEAEMLLKDQHELENINRDLRNSLLQREALLSCDHVCATATVASVAAVTASTDETSSPREQERKQRRASCLPINEKEDERNVATTIPTQLLKQAHDNGDGDKTVDLLNKVVEGVEVTSVDDTVHNPMKACSHSSDTNNHLHHQNQNDDLDVLVSLSSSAAAAAAITSSDDNDDSTCNTSLPVLLTAGSAAADAAVTHECITVTAAAPDTVYEHQQISEADKDKVELNRLASENIILRQCVDDSVRTQNDVYQDLEKLCDLKSELETAVNALKGEVWSLNKHLETSYQECNTLRSMKDQLNIDRIKNQETLSSLRLENTEMMMNNENIKKEKCDMEKEMESVTRIAEERKIHIEEMNNAYQLLNEYYEDLQSAYNELYEKHSSLCNTQQQQQSNEQNEIDVVMNALFTCLQINEEDSSSTVNLNKTDMVCNKISLLKTDILVLNDTISELKKINEALLERVSMNEDMLAESESEAAQTLNSIQHEILAVTELNKKLSHELEKEKANNKTDEHLMSRQKIDLEILNAKLITKQTNIDSLIRANSELTYTNVQLQEEIDDDRKRKAASSSELCLSICTLSEQQDFVNHIHNQQTKEHAAAAPDVLQSTEGIQQHQNSDLAQLNGNDEADESTQTQFTTHADLGVCKVLRDASEIILSGCIVDLKESDLDNSCGVDKLGVEIRSFIKTCSSHINSLLEENEQLSQKHESCLFQLEELKDHNNLAAAKIKKLRNEARTTQAQNQQQPSSEITNFEKFEETKKRLADLEQQNDLLQRSEATLLKVVDDLTEKLECELRKPKSVAATTSSTTTASTVSSNSNINNVFSSSTKRRGKEKDSTQIKTSIGVTETKLPALEMMIPTNTSYDTSVFNETDEKCRKRLTQKK